MQRVGEITKNAERPTIGAVAGSIYQTLQFSMYKIAHHPEQTENFHENFSSEIESIDDRITT